MLRENLRRIKEEPTLLAIEVAWRWVFGAVAIALLVYATLHLQRAVVVSGDEEALLQSGSPDLALEALAAIGARTLPIAFRLAEMIVPVLVVLWVAAASMGRAEILSRLLGRNKGSLRWSGFVGVHALRAFSVIGLGGAYLLDSFVAGWFTNPQEPNLFVTTLVFLVLFVVSVAVWMWVHWVLSLAAIYPVKDGLGVWESVRAAMGLVRRRRRELGAIATANGAARTVVGIVFTVLGLMPLAFYGVAPRALVAIEIVIALVYCAVSDFLLLGRLVGYVEVAKSEG